MAWFVSRRNCPSFLTANTVAGPLDGAPRSGRATGNHQDPPTTLLLPGRTAHPRGAPPHFASSPALALEKPVQSRPRSIASPATPSLTAPVSHLPAIWPTERPRQLAPTQPAKGTPCPPHLEFRPPWPLRAAIIVSGCLLHAALIPIYWNLAWPVRPPLPINPGVNSSVHRFGGFGLTNRR